MSIKILVGSGIQQKKFGSDLRQKYPETLQRMKTMNERIITDQSVNQFIVNRLSNNHLNRSVNPFINRAIQSINRSIQSINRSIQSINRSIQSINRSFD